MDEYDFYEDIYFDKIKEKNKSKAIKIKGIYQYVNNLNPPSVPQIHIPFKILIQQSELFVDQKINSLEKIIERLKKYGLTKEETPQLINKINLSLQWAQDFKGFDNVIENYNVFENKLEDNEKKALEEC